ncbi:D-isomer specific 2-hydroxyacid dehydrogenase, NAD-binding protein [Ketogulonicigenium robustum]|uniref:D-isomer specific 2-hydroxyacid dehydrogenase, NAD-binding protein n=1 Tax=Ketogulonicigenium robustum TaxID=92947 RepID=A0A1W6P378_9RHOB|nr:2-hydroxyacid dehydrogenase [Ketogulonicigenium robustum]ARO15800.1 D-isomer specific 2-hydroxyacid dehydrogenase, NAD-binding protein [Ketogulonicigenium robustum]
MTIDILQTGPLLPETTAALQQQGFTLHPYYNAPDRAALLADVAPRIRGLTAGAAPAALIAQLPALEMIANYGAGYDRVDTAAASARGIRVSNTPDPLLNDVVAELGVGMMIEMTRRIAWHDRFVRAGQWQSGPAAPLTGTLVGKKAGFVGMGRIGIEIADRLRALKMQICYTARSPKPDLPYEYYPDLAAMAHDVDWLIVIVPGGAETQGLVSRAVLEALGPQGHVLNLARGSVIDEPAMVELLQSGALGGAALDVFAHEPKVPEALFALDNVLLQPHVGGAVAAARVAMGELMVANLAAHFAGRPLPSPVI